MSKLAKIKKSRWFNTRRQYHIILNWLFPAYDVPLRVIVSHSTLRDGGWFHEFTMYFTINCETHVLTYIKCCVAFRLIVDFIIYLSVKRGLWLVIIDPSTTLCPATIWRNGCIENCWLIFDWLILTGLIHENPSIKLHYPNSIRILRILGGVMSYPVSMRMSFTFMGK